jgi:hypothetical protein
MAVSLVLLQLPLIERTRIRRRVRRHECYACGYNLRGTTGEFCSECGSAVPLRTGLAQADQNVRRYYLVRRRLVVRRLLAVMTAIASGFTIAWILSFPTSLSVRSSRVLRHETTLNETRSLLGNPSQQSTLTQNPSLGEKLWTAVIPRGSPVSVVRWNYQYHRYVWNAAVSDYWVEFDADGVVRNASNQFDTHDANVFLVVGIVLSCLFAPFVWLINMSRDSFFTARKPTVAGSVR